MNKELIECINDSIKTREERMRISRQKQIEIHDQMIKQRGELVKYINYYFNDLPEEIEIKLKEQKVIDDGREEEYSHLMGAMEWVETHQNFRSMNYSKILLAPNHNIRLWDIFMKEWRSLYNIDNIHLIIIKEMIPWFEEQIKKYYGCLKEE